MHITTENLRDIATYGKRNTDYVVLPLAKYKDLPDEIIHHILSYNDTIKLRNNKYMNQIIKNDQRYTILCQIPREIEFSQYDNNRIIIMKINAN